MYSLLLFMCILRTRRLDSNKKTWAACNSIYNCQLCNCKCVCVCHYSSTAAWSCLLVCLCLHLSITVKSPLVWWCECVCVCTSVSPPVSLCFGWHCESINMISEAMLVMATTEMCVRVLVYALLYPCSQPVWPVYLCILFSSCVLFDSLLTTSVVFISQV